MYDEYRMGVLRFKTEKNGLFLDDNRLTAAPPWAGLFRITSTNANKIIREVIKSVKAWRHEAEKVGIFKRQQDRMASAFRMTESVNIVLH